MSSAFTFAIVPILKEVVPSPKPEHKIRCTASHDKYLLLPQEMSFEQFRKRRIKAVPDETSPAMYYLSAP